jgi:PAS domain S-box-containing protein
VTIRVLLVAERGRDFTIVRDLLARTELGAELDWVTTCEAALGKMIRERHDVALATDRVGQHSAADLFRLGGAVPATPIVILAAEDDPALEDEMMAAGAADVIARPRLEPSVLDRTIRHALWRCVRVRSLHERLSTLGTVVELGHAALAYLDRDERVVFANRRFTEFVGAPDDPAGRTLAEILGEDHERLRPYLDAATRGRSVEFEAELRGRDQRVRRARIVHTPDIDDRDLVVGVLVSLEDVTHPSGATGTGLAEERLRDFALAATDWLWETDIDGRIAWLSDGAERAIGRRLDRLRGARLWELGADDGAGPEREALARDMEQGRSFRDVVLDYVDDQRRPRALTISGYALRDADGLFRGYRGIGRDATETVTAAARELEVMDGIAGPMAASLTRQAFGQGALETTMPEVFGELVADYAAELERALARGALAEPDGSPAQELARRLGFLRATARDAIRIHRAALPRALGGCAPDQMAGGLDTARIVLIEVLAHLVAYYRGGFAGERPEPVAVAGRRTA